MKQSLTATILMVCLSTALVSCQFKNQDSVVDFAGEHLVAMTKNGVMAQNENAAKEPYMAFMFTENQKKEFLQRMSSNFGTGFCVHLSALNPSGVDQDSGFTLELFYEDDLEKGRVSDCIDGKGTHKFSHSIIGKYSDLRNKEADIVISLNQTSAPAGFIVRSDVDFSVDSVKFTDKQLGYSLHENNCLFAFGAGGGRIPSDLSQWDFSNATALFSRSNSEYSIMPYFVIGFEPLTEAGSWNNQRKAAFSFGGEKISIRRTPSTAEIPAQETVIQCSSLNGSYGLLKFYENQNDVNEILLVENSKDLCAKNGNSLFPLKTDLGMILNWPQQKWRNREYEFFNWSLFPTVYFFDFADYNIQNQFFTRMAYFVEKVGYKGTFITDAQVNTLHGYNAHDYKAVDLARFFTEASRQKIKLNSYEILLRNILVANGIIIDQGNGAYGEGTGSVISISRESADYLRAQLMAHESFHGIYFSNEGFRNFVETQFDQFNPTAWDFIQIYFTTQPSLMYDIEDQYLIRNEFMAYLLQMSLSNVRDYYLTRAWWNSVQKNEKQQADYVIRTNAEDFYEAASILSDYVFDKWGLCAGRVSLVSRVD